MLQTLFQIVISGFVFITACLLFFYSYNPKFYGTIMSRDLCCLLAATPALNAFLMFVIEAILIVVIETCFFRHISNSVIISLDIIYFISMMLLVLYHRFKKSNNLLVKVA